MLGSHFRALSTYFSIWALKIIKFPQFKSFKHVKKLAEISNQNNEELKIYRGSGLFDCSPKFVIATIV